jgi:hypothetical protein
MNKSFTLVLAALAFLNSSVKADFVDSVMNFTLKFHFNETGWLEKGNYDIKNITKSSLKTADFIAAYGTATDQTFSKKAQLIWRDEYDFEGYQEGYKIYIRDPGKPDVDVSTAFNEDTSDSPSVSKGKYHYDLGTGTFFQIYTSVLTFRAQAGSPGTPTLDVTGLNNFNIKTVIVRDTENLVDLGTVNGKITGKAYFLDAKRQKKFTGVVDGTFKLSGPKVVKVPN